MSIEVEIEKINNQTWRISEVNRETENAVDSYLLCGTRRAVLIDTLMFTSNLYDIVREFTSLPLDVIITHGHIDHVGESLPVFTENDCAVFMDLRDLFLVENTNFDFIKTVNFKDLGDKKLFDLGRRNIEIISFPGHTPGSLVLLDRNAELIFTGDSIGSGPLWMQLPEALTLPVFEKNLKELYDNLRCFDNLKIYPGHKMQSPVLLTSQYIQDTLKLTQDIISGTVVGEDDVTVYLGERIPCKKAKNGLMIGYIYDPNKMK